MEKYKAYLGQCAEKVKSRDLVWGYAAHDHTSIKDRELSQIGFLIKCAQDKGIEIKSYKDFYYEEMRKKWQS